MAEKKDFGFLRGTFGGKINGEDLYPFPQVSSEEGDILELLTESLKRFSQEISSEEIENRGELGPEILGKMAELGLFGLIIPEAYGGIGLSQVAYGRVFELLGMIDASIAVTVGAHSSIGLKGLLLAGSENQKKKYLPKLASGEMIAAFALTEAGSGSDAYSIKTRATLQSDGSYVINGSKIWITNGGMASFFTVFAKTENKDDEGNLKEKITAFIVTRDMKGVSTGPEEKKMGIKGSSTVEVHFDNVCVPAENILGEPGKGFKLAMQILNSGRLGLATGCVGGGKRLLDLARKHALGRKQFGKSISEFGLIKEKLAEMASQLYALEAASYLTCSMVDKGIEDYSMESAACKVAGSEILWFVANEAMQISGGSSYMKEYPYERLMRDARINMIFEGTNEILRCFIALNGIKSPGEKLKLLAASPLDNPIKSMGLYYEYFSERVSRTLYGDSLENTHEALKREAAMVEEDVVSLAESTERALQKHRGKIVVMQLVQKRLADIAIDLYLMTAAICKTTHLLNDDPEKHDFELRLTKMFVLRAHRRNKERFEVMLRNADEMVKSISDSLCAKPNYPEGLI